MTVAIRPAVTEDLPALHAVIERAYRGDSARLGWTHEADLLEGARIDAATLHAIVDDTAQRLLVAFEGAAPVGCVNIAARGGGLAYLGLLCIEPTRQAAGLGRRLIAAAEAHAHEAMGCTAIEMTVIEQRRELIAWYRRRGYTPTGERRPFPILLDPPFFMTVLAKRLG